MASDEPDFTRTRDIIVAGGGNIFGAANLGLTGARPQHYRHINKYFDAMGGVIFPDWTSPINLDLYWYSISDTRGIFHKPIDWQWINAYSKRAFICGQVTSYVQLVNLFGLATHFHYFCGFEHGDGMHAGIVSFVARSDGVWALAFHGGGQEVNISNILPADAFTSRYFYTVKLNRNCAEFFIGRSGYDTRLLAVIVITGQGANYTLQGPPYGICVANGAIPQTMTTLVEVSSPVGTSVDMLLDPRWFRCADGVEITPRTYRLYQWQTNNLLDSKEVPVAGYLRSHPFPIYGYHKKTVYFRANANGQVEIYAWVQSGIWRRIYNLAAYVAATDLIIDIDPDFPIAYLQYTAQAGSFIDNAEVHLS